MKNISDLYNSAMTLLEACNSILMDDPLLPTINTKLSGVVKDLNEVRIKKLTGIKEEPIK